MRSSVTRVGGMLLLAVGLALPASAERPAGEPTQAQAQAQAQTQTQPQRIKLGNAARLASPRLVLHDHGYPLFARPRFTFQGVPVIVRTNPRPDATGVIRPYDADAYRRGVPLSLLEEQAGVIRPDRVDARALDGRVPLTRYLRHQGYHSRSLFGEEDAVGVVRPYRVPPAVPAPREPGTLRAIGPSADGSADRAAGDDGNASSAPASDGVTVIAAGRTLQNAPTAVQDARNDAWALLNAGYYRDAQARFAAGDAPQAAAGRALASALLGQLHAAAEQLTAADAMQVADRLDEATADRLRAVAPLLPDDAGSDLRRVIGAAG